MQQLWRTAESLPCSVLNLFLVVLGAAACFIAGAVKRNPQMDRAIMTANIRMTNV